MLKIHMFLGVYKPVKTFHQVAYNLKDYFQLEHEL